MSLLARKIRLIMKLRRCGITDTAVLSAIERVPREVFIPPMFHDQAYEDTALPIGCHQTISQPLVVASMTQELKVNDRHKVLEIGTGSGYQAAILAKLCRRVYSIERHKPLLMMAEQRFNELRVRNLTCKAADGMKGWIEQAPFDRIIVTAAASLEPPQALLDQLSIGVGIHTLASFTGTNTFTVHPMTSQDDAFIGGRDVQFSLRGLNAAYRERHGFPFVIAVKGLDRYQIMAAMEQRLAHDRDTELQACQREIGKIARLRLQARFGHLFDRYDADKDGAVTRSELITLRATAIGGGIDASPAKGGRDARGREGRRWR